MNIKNKSYIFTWGFLAIICVACTLGPKYSPPEVDTPIEWKGKTADKTEIPDVGLWWEIFDDPVLNCLEESAIANSPNLYAALDRVAQARAIAGIDRADLYPQLNLAPSFSSTGQLIQVFLPPGLIPPSQEFRDIFRVHQRQYNLPLNLSFELDLWGKYRGAYKSDLLELESQGENFYSSLLTLTTDVASNYFQMRSLDSQLRLLAENIEILKRNFEIADSRYKKGLTDLQAVASAEQELANTRATYHDIQRQRTLQEDILATLVGTPASILELEFNPLSREAPPQIPPGTPSDILLQRPDIIAAERHMAAQHALIGVAYAAFFPSFELVGTLGFSSPISSQFLSWRSRLWMIGVNAAQTVFDAGRNQSNLNLAYANFNESLHNYEQKVLTAFQEVEDALNNLQRQAQSYENYVQSVQASQVRLRVSTNRYNRGLGNYLDVLDSERTKIQAELNEASFMGFRYISTVQLIKAIGGGWKNCNLALD